MAQAISERLLERAVGPIDLSYAYQKIDAVSKQIAAEDRARKQEAAKQYYTDLASMNKEKIGVRSADMGEISALYKEWSNIGKELSQNPNLINKDPELYGEKNAQVEALYSKLMTGIRDSKNQAKKEIDDYRMLTSPDKRDYFRPGAAEDFKKKVMMAPTSKVFQTGDGDLTKYYSTTIDGSKFLNNLDAGIRTNALGVSKKIDKSYKPVVGEKKYFTYDKMPLIESIYLTAANELDGALGKDANSFAIQQLEQLKTSGRLDEVIAKFNKFWDPANKEGASKYYENIPALPPMFKDGSSERQQYIDYITASQFLSRIPQSFKEDYEMTPEQELRFKKLGQPAQAPRAATAEEVQDAKYGNLWSNIYNKVSTAAASVDKFNTDEQEQLLKRARFVSGANWLTNRDIYVDVNKNTGQVELKSMIKVYRDDDSLLYDVGGSIGELPAPKGASSGKSKSSKAKGKIKGF